MNSDSDNEFVIVEHDINSQTLISEEISGDMSVETLDNSINTSDKILGNVTNTTDKNSNDSIDTSEILSNKLDIKNILDTKIISDTSNSDQIIPVFDTDDNQTSKSKCWSIMIRISNIFKYHRLSGLKKQTVPKFIKGIKIRLPDDSIYIYFKSINMELSQTHAYALIPYIWNCLGHFRTPFKIIECEREKLDQIINESKLLKYLKDGDFDKKYNLINQLIKETGWLVDDLGTEPLYSTNYLKHYVNEENQEIYTLLN